MSIRKKVKVCVSTVLLLAATSMAFVGCSTSDDDDDTPTSDVVTNNNNNSNNNANAGGNESTPTNSDSNTNGNSNTGDSTEQTPSVTTPEESAEPTPTLAEGVYVAGTLSGTIGAAPTGKLFVTLPEGWAVIKARSGSTQTAAYLMIGETDYHLAPESALAVGDTSFTLIPRSDSFTAIPEGVANGDHIKVKFDRKIVSNTGTELPAADVLVVDTESTATWSITGGDTTTPAVGDDVTTPTTGDETTTPSTGNETTTPSTGGENTTPSTGNETTTPTTGDETTTDESAIATPVITVTGTIKAVAGVALTSTSDNNELVVTLPEGYFFNTRSAGNGLGNTLSPKFTIRVKEAIAKADKSRVAKIYLEASTGVSSSYDGKKITFSLALDQIYRDGDEPQTLKALGVTPEYDNSGAVYNITAAE